MIAPNPEQPLLNSGKKRGPNTAAGKAKALSNLRPFPKGQSGNPDGRPPSAGLSVREWWNTMQDWSREELEAVVADQKAPVNKVSAARAWIGACASGADLDRIMDRTEGRPAQSVDMTSNGQTILGPLLLDGDREL